MGTKVPGIAAPGLKPGAGTIRSRPSPAQGGALWNSSIPTDGNEGALRSAGLWHERAVPAPGFNPGLQKPRNLAFSTPPRDRGVITPSPRSHHPILEESSPHPRGVITPSLRSRHPILEERSPYPRAASTPSPSCRCSRSSVRGIAEGVRGPAGSAGASKNRGTFRQKERRRPPRGPGFAGDPREGLLRGVRGRPPWPSLRHRGQG
jgi:hypothetical protein